MKKLDFAKYYDITDIAKAYDSEYKQYVKIFICVDTNDFWICRLLKDFRSDEEEGHVEDEGSYILERNKIAKDFKGEQIQGILAIHCVLESDASDGYGGWDLENCDSEENAIEMLDDGFGIGTIEK